MKREKAIERERERVWVLGLCGLFFPFLLLCVWNFYVSSFFGILMWFFQSLMWREREREEDIFLERQSNRVVEREVIIKKN